jgi:hypothetical protein
MGTLKMASMLSVVITFQCLERTHSANLEIGLQNNPKEEFHGAFDFVGPSLGEKSFPVCATSRVEVLTERMTPNDPSVWLLRSSLESPSECPAKQQSSRTL